MSLGRVVREMRLHLCSTGAGSQGARDFVNKYYSQIKQSNPTLPVLVRECIGVPAVLQARLPFGEEKSFQINGMTAEEIKAIVDGLGK